MELKEEYKSQNFVQGSIDWEKLRELVAENAAAYRLKKEQVVICLIYRNAKA